MTKILHSSLILNSTGQLRKGHTMQDQGEVVEEKNNFLKLLRRHRRLLGFVLPAAIFHLFWWAFMIKRSLWGYFMDRWHMSLTMALGSMVAGECIIYSVSATM